MNNQSLFIRLFANAAFYCGIFGHKPTVGVINTRGCTFRTGKEASTMVVAGPMSRHATDLLPLLKVSCTIIIIIIKIILITICCY